MKVLTATAAILAGAVVLAFVVLGPKKVSWSEEVILNTGQSIWVERSVVYSLRGDAGNPLDLAFRPAWSETIAFEWGGRRYFYEGEADLMVIAISEAGSPVLIAPAANKDWGFHHDYRCTTPYYVELIPDESGRNWHWPTSIGQWTFGLPRNLMRRRESAAEMAGRYTSEQKRQEDHRDVLKVSRSAIVDPNYASQNCRRGERNGN